jgi:hypothetical protein
LLLAAIAEPSRPYNRESCIVTPINQALMLLYTVMEFPSRLQEKILLLF